LIGLMGSDNGVNRYWAARVLAAIGYDAQSAEPVLIKALNGQDKEIQLEAAAALGRIGLDQQEALATARRLLHDEDRHIRERAAGVIREITGAAQPE
jgi:HEAT repeat protein